jgi:hypothetical protein
METIFIAFIAARPSINKSAFAKELQIDRLTIEKILLGQRMIPKSRRGDFLRLMQHYGCKLP